jgi:hypothetical protein
MTLTEQSEAVVLGSYSVGTTFGHEKIAYLGGPMSGYEYSNFDQFERVERILRKNGWTIYSPRENDIASGLNVYGTETGTDQSYFLRWDFARISEDAECVIFLPGWRNSPGSNKERQVAIWTGKPIYEIVEIDGLSRYVTLRKVTDENL